MPEHHGPNGPHSRELGKISGWMEAIDKRLDAMQADQNDFRNKLFEVKTMQRVLVERVFILGAITFGAGFLGGGMVKDYWSKPVAEKVSHERPDEKSPQPVDLAAYHPDGRYRGIPVYGNVPER